MLPWRARELLSLFNEPGGTGKIALAWLLWLVPGANLLVLGYAHACVGASLESGEFVLSEWGDFPALLEPGWRVFLLLSLLFSPFLACCLLGLLSFAWTLHAGGPGVVGRSFLTMFFFSMALFSLPFSLGALPACTLRFAEGNEILWAVSPPGMIRDIVEMGWPYGENLLAVACMLLCGEALFLFLAVALCLSAFGPMAGVAFFLVSSGFLHVYSLLLSLKLVLPFFSDLSYKLY